MPLSPFLAHLARRQDLSTEETRAAFDAIFTGHVPPDQIAAFLTGLRDKGETADEIIGAAASMRSRMRPVEAPAEAMDIVGTGGDAQNTFNISTAAAIVVAACGVPVAKHGNRAASSRSGSSDVLAALGINLDAPPAALRRCLAEADLCFMFAPHHHPAMRQVAEIRKQLKTRTIFNLLGPLTNPAGVKRHLIGVFARGWLEPMAKALHRLGSEAAWVTHGQDGMDEITTTAPTDVAALRRGAIDRFVLDPEQAGLARAAPEALQGGEAGPNAAALKRLLQGEHGAYRDIVLFNAGAALAVAGKTGDVREGMTSAERAIDSGAARKVLEILIRLTNET